MLGLLVQQKELIVLGEIVRKKIFIVLAIVLSSLLFYCSNNSGPDPFHTKPRIAVIPKGTTHVFWKSVERGAKKAGNEQDVHIIWKGPLKENVGGDVEIDYDAIVDELENHIETFKQIAGMGEESRPYFTVTPDEYIEYMDFDDPDRKVVFVVNGEAWEDYKPFTTGAEEIGKIEDIIPGFNIVDLNYVVNPD